MRNLRTIVAVAAVTLGLSYAQPVTTTPIGADAYSAVLEALSGPAGEYQAFAAYSAVLEKYGAVQPYASIRGAEARHVNMLQMLLGRYGVPVPENTYLSKVTLPADLVSIAKQEVQAEIDNVAMYEKLLPKVSSYPDITRVFLNLQAASRNNHLPAFQAAVQNGGKLSGQSWNQTNPGGMMGGSGMGTGYGRSSGMMGGQGMGGQGFGPGAAYGDHPCGFAPMGGGRGPRR
jgi:hypothetical protein